MVYCDIDTHTALSVVHQGVTGLQGKRGSPGGPGREVGVAGDIIMWRSHDICPTVSLNRVSRDQWVKLDQGVHPALQ